MAAAATSQTTNAGATKAATSKKTTAAAKPTAITADASSSGASVVANAPSQVLTSPSSGATSAAIGTTGSDVLQQSAIPIQSQIYGGSSDASKLIVSSCLFRTARLEEFSTKHELARNFYDDDEFCPIPSEKLPQVAEHRERIRSRTSPRSSPSSSPTRSNAYHQRGSPLRQSPRTRAVPIVDPSKRTMVNVTQATNNNSNNLLYSVPIQESRQSTTTPSWVSPRRYGNGIPIVDPQSGHMIVPNGNTGFPLNQHHQAGYYVSVR
ncbi:hypothetical protein Unana1_05831 [Umbelopsis nana]